MKITDAGNRSFPTTKNIDHYNQLVEAGYKIKYYDLCWESSPNHQCLSIWMVAIINLYVHVKCDQDIEMPTCINWFVFKQEANMEWRCCCFLQNDLKCLVQHHYDISFSHNKYMAGYPRESLQESHAMKGTRYESRSVHACYLSFLDQKLVNYRPFQVPAMQKWDLIKNKMRKSDTLFLYVLWNYTLRCTVLRNVDIILVYFDAYVC